jgi:hypothetical protein
MPLRFYTEVIENNDIKQNRSAELVEVRLSVKRPSTGSGLRF